MVRARQDITEVDAFVDDHYDRSHDMVLLGERDGWLIGFCYRYLVDFTFPISGRDGVGEAEYRNPRLTVLGNTFRLEPHDTELSPAPGDPQVAWFRAFGEHDAALVYLPVSGHEGHLGIDDPLAVVNHTLRNGSSIFGLEFILMSPESVKLMRKRAASEVNLAGFAAGMAIAALVLFPLLGPSIAATLPMSALGGEGRKLVARALPLALKLGRDLLLREDGFVAERIGDPTRLALLGVDFPAADSDGYGLLAKFVGTLIANEGEEAQFVGFGAQAEGERGQVFLPESEMCLSAEVLSRGLVRLDMSNQAVLREFPELVTAALSAVETGQNLAAVWAEQDPEYVTQLRTLSRIVTG